MAIEFNHMSMSHQTTSISILHLCGSKNRIAHTKVSVFRLSLSLFLNTDTARRFPFPFPKMAAVPSSLAPEPGKKLDFMALVDKEDPDDIYELIDELAVGESVLSRLLDVSDAFEKTIATKNPIFCSSSSLFPLVPAGWSGGLVVVWWWSLHCACAPTGSYGSVYKARHLPTGSIVAMKIMEPDEGQTRASFVQVESRGGTDRCLALQTRS